MRILLIGTFALLTMTLAACGGSDGVKPSPTTFIQSVQAPVDAPAAGDGRRLDVINYFTEARAVMADYYATREKFGILIGYSDRNSQLTLSGDLEVLQAIHAGFVERFRSLQASAQSLELNEITNLTETVMLSEAQWLDSYTSAVEDEDIALAEELRVGYLEHLDQLSVDVIDRLTESLLSQFEIPAGQVNYFPNDVGITLLHPGYVTTARIGR